MVPARHLREGEARLLPSWTGGAHPAPPLPIRSRVKRALSLLPGLLRSALAPSTMARKRRRCWGDFSCGRTKRGRRPRPTNHGRGIPPPPPTPRPLWCPARSPQSSSPGGAPTYRVRAESLPLGAQEVGEVAVLAELHYHHEGAWGGARLVLGDGEHAGRPVRSNAHPPSRTAPSPPFLSKHSQPLAPKTCAP